MNDGPDLIYPVPHPEGVEMVAVVDGKMTRVLWPKEQALNRCIELMQYIAEVK